MSCAEGLLKESTELPVGAGERVASGSVLSLTHNTAKASIHAPACQSQPHGFVWWAATERSNLSRESGWCPRLDKSDAGEEEAQQGVDHERSDQGTIHCQSTAVSVMVVHAGRGRAANQCDARALHLAQCESWAVGVVIRPVVDDRAAEVY